MDEPPFPMTERSYSLMTCLNRVAGALQIIGVKQMPRLVFDDFDDYMSVIEAMPHEMMPDPGKPIMLAGFHIERDRKPVNEADRFVAQEIGA